jgi:molecular chaperone GrpE
VSSESHRDDAEQPEQPATEDAPAASVDDEPAPSEGGPDESPGLAELKVQLAERTADLQRLQAEYVNYKRRVDRDREAVRLGATAAALGAVLPVLDDVDRARDHGELEGGFKAVAESLERAVTTLGLERFGKPGEEFDPRIHEALMHDYADDVDTVSVQTVLQVGYRVGDRLIRAARVAVVEPMPVDAPVTPQAAASEEPASEEAASEPESEEPEGGDPEGGDPEGGDESA